MTKKRAAALGFAVIILAIVIVLAVFTRSRALTTVLGVDSFSSCEILSGSTWYPFTEQEDESHYKLDALDADSEAFSEIAALLDGATVRPSLIGSSFSTVLGAPYSSLSCRWGSDDRWMCFDGKYLVIGSGTESTGKLYYVSKATGQALSDIITEYGYNVQEYLDSLQNAAAG